MYQELMSFTKGVFDSLHLFKCILTEREKNKLSFKQTNLANVTIKQQKCDGYTDLLGISLENFLDV